MTALGRDIVGTYRFPVKTLRRMAAQPVSERRLLAWVMGASVIAFVVTLPRLIAVYQPSDAEPLAGFVANRIVGSLIFAPLFMYLLAALSHLTARMLGGKGDWQNGRLALFWTLFAVQPVLLVTEILKYLAPNATLITATNLLSMLVFIGLWLAAIRAVYWPGFKG